MDEALDPLPRTREDTEAHLRSILATVPDAMVVIDENARILSFSAAAEKMFGYAESEVLSKNVNMLMPAPDRERHDGYLRNYLTTGVRKIIGIGRLTTARHRDGYTFPIELLIGEAWVGERRIFTGFVRDLTERQQTELRLQDLQSELAHVRRVSEMSTLATSLAHELNQPLTAIANYSESARMLLGGIPPSDTVTRLDGALEAVAAQVLRAGEIVRRLRDFMSHGGTSHRPESLPRLVTEANALALVGTREHGIEVEIDHDPNAERVLADRIQIQQVLVNLIRNAIDAMMDSPQRKLRIESRRDGERVRVSVQDTGSGLDSSVAARLFQPFITSKQSGMGVGLSICRTIIEAHGGDIWFESPSDGGTIFHFTLPVSEQSADSDETPPDESST
jgi:two-component system sensor kinase FixL